MAHRDGAPVHTALRQADMAMYWAKSEGRGRYCFFDRTMDEKLQQRVELEAEIKGAIEAGQIVPYYQPLVDLTTSKPVGFEVLARWQHPVRGVLVPEAFISIAEDTGNIAEMTAWRSTISAPAIRVSTICANSISTFIKIDRSFVTKMLDKPEEARIVKAIVSMSRALGLHTTAEGIETTQVLDRL